MSLRYNAKPFIDMARSRDASDKWANKGSNITIIFQTWGIIDSTMGKSK